MNQKEKAIISGLVAKYNSILLHSVQIAVAEDLINLIIANREDENFELKNFIQNKESFKQFVVGEFFKINSSNVLSELSTMEETYKPKQKRKGVLKLPL